jgi:AcrR family transcriptional regulator
VRTVHHYFPDRHARVEALAAWAEETFGPLVAPLEAPEDLPMFVRAAYERAGRHLELTRAMYVTGLGNEVRLSRLKARRAKIQEILATLGADPMETRRAAAVVAMLASSEAGVPLMDIHGLDLANAGEAAAEAVEAIVARLTLAGRRKSIKGS